MRPHFNLEYSLEYSPHPCRAVSQDEFTLPHAAATMDVLTASSHQTPPAVPLGGVAGPPLSPAPPVGRQRSFTLVSSPNMHRRAPVLAASGTSAPVTRLDQLWLSPPGASRHQALRRRVGGVAEGAAASCVADPRPAVRARARFVLRSTEVAATDAPLAPFRPTQSLWEAVWGLLPVASITHTPCTSRPPDQLPPSFVHSLYGWGEARSEPFMLLNELLLTAVIELGWTDVQAHLHWARGRVSLRVEGTHPARPVSVNTLLQCRVADMMRCLNPATETTTILEVVHRLTGKAVLATPLQVVADAGGGRARVFDPVAGPQCLSKVPADSALVLHILPQLQPPPQPRPPQKEVPAAPPAATPAGDQTPAADLAGMDTSWAAGIPDIDMGMGTGSSIAWDGEYLGSAAADDDDFGSSFSLINSPSHHLAAVAMSVASTPPVMMIGDAAAAPAAAVGLGDLQWCELFFWNVRQVCAGIDVQHEAADSAIASAWELAMTIPLRHAPTLRQAPLPLEEAGGVLLLPEACPVELRRVSPLILGCLPSVTPRGKAGTATTLALMPLARTCIQHWRFVLYVDPSILALELPARDQWCHLAGRAMQQRLQARLLPLLCSRMTTPSWWHGRAEHMPQFFTTDPFTEEWTFTTLLRLQQGLAARWDGKPPACRGVARTQLILQELGKLLGEALHLDGLSIHKRLSGACAASTAASLPPRALAWWKAMFEVGLRCTVQAMNISPSTVLALLRLPVVRNPWCQRHMQSFVTDDPLFQRPPLTQAELWSSGVGLMLRHIHYVTVLCVADVQEALDVALQRRAGSLTDRMRAVLNARPHVTMVHSHIVPPSQLPVVVVGHLRQHQLRGADDAQLDVTVDVCALLGCIDWMRFCDIPLSLMGQGGDAVAAGPGRRLAAGDGPTVAVHTTTLKGVRRTNETLVPRLLAPLIPALLQQATSFVPWEAAALQSEVTATCFGAAVARIEALSAIAAELRRPPRRAKRDKVWAGHNDPAILAYLNTLRVQDHSRSQRTKSSYPSSKKRRRDGTQVAQTLRHLHSLDQATLTSIVLRALAPPATPAARPRKRSRFAAKVVVVST